MAAFLGLTLRMQVEIRRGRIRKIRMTYQEAQTLLKKIIQAKDKDELQDIVSNNISACDGVFFAELEARVEQFRAKGDESSAAKLKALGDYMARLRFMI